VTAALLLSGGMDSLCVAWWQRPALAITIDYGQLPAAAEIDAASAICEELRIQHSVVRVNCRSLGSGDMAGQEASVHAPASDWWPYRNQLLITLAGMRALATGAGELLLGTVSTDESHRDGSPEFVQSMSQLMREQEGSLVVRAPAIHLSTIELVRVSEVPMSILAWAHSCHRSDVPCGACRGCNKYFETLGELEHELDPLGQPRTSREK
jgi:7-cyano-7-deazaguanine synthase